MSNEAPISLTVKVGEYGDLLTFRGDDAESFIANAMNAPTVIEWAIRIGQKAREGAAPAAPVVQAPAAEAPPWTAAPAAAPAAPAAPAQTSGRTCQHGQMVYREGVGKKGPWRAYFCPAPKDTPGQCDPQFLR